MDHVINHSLRCWDFQSCKAWSETWHGDPQLLDFIPKQLIVFFFLSKKKTFHDDLEHLEDFINEYFISTSSALQIRTKKADPKNSSLPQTPKDLVQIHSRAHVRHQLHVQNHHAAQS